MMSLIDSIPMQVGWGVVYQSGVLASQDWDHKGLIVCLAGNLNLEGPCLWISMPDNNTDTLPDDVLVDMVDTVLAFLRNGHDVLIHCVEGKYRSTYLDVAVHMKGLHYSVEDAFDYVKRRHAIADLREGTRSQLKRMETVLKGD